MLLYVLFFVLWVIASAAVVALSKLIAEKAEVPFLVVVIIMMFTMSSFALVIML